MRIRDGGEFMKNRDFVAEVKRRKGLLTIVGLVVGSLVLVWRFFSVPFNFSFSAPVVPMLGSLLGVAGIEFETAVSWVLLIFFILGPVSLYVLVFEITGRWMSATIASILYSLPIFRSRFEALVVSGDGAHIAALTLIPLAAFWLLRFLKRGSFVSAIASSFGVLLVALTSPFGFFVLMVILTVVTFSEMLLGLGRLKFLRFLLVVGFSIGLSAFWYNPEFVRLTLVSAPGRAVIATIKNLIPISFFTLPILGTFGFLIFDKRAHLQPLFVALGLTTVFGLISFAGGLAKFAVSAQSRYLPEVTMAIAILWGVVGTTAYDVIGRIAEQKWFPVPMAKRDLLRKGLFVGFVVISLVVALVVPHREAVARRSGRLVAGVTETIVIEISEIRERIGRVHMIVGYSISCITLFVMGWMYRLLRKEGGKV
jgi:hypothetical protein